MKETEFGISFDNFSKALARLKEGITEAQTQIAQDGVIQRFEFTFELLWKTLKLLLLQSNVECKSPRECFKEAFKLGLIANDKIFIDMLNDRNISVHAYSETKSANIFSHIKFEYVDAINDLMIEIQKYVQRTDQ